MTPTNHCSCRGRKDPAIKATRPAPNIIISGAISSGRIAASGFTAYLPTSATTAAVSTQPSAR